MASPAASSTSRILLILALTRVFLAELRFLNWRPLHEERRHIIGDGGSVDTFGVTEAEFLVGLAAI
jgi:integrase